MMTIAVAGATGTVGRHVERALSAIGHRVVPLTRSAGVDVSTGEGLDAALRDVDAVVDVLNIATQSATKAEKFFTRTTSALLRAETANDVRHHVLLSIVGIEHAPGGYYAGKIAQEQAVRAGGVPWTILRATQFHEFAGQVLERTSLGPLALVPIARLRPVAAAEVGDALAELAAAGARRATIELRGPADERLVDMARRVAGGRRLIVPIPLPGGLGRAMRDGSLRGDDNARQGTTTFAQWLAGTRT